MCVRGPTLGVHDETERGHGDDNRYDILVQRRGMALRDAPEHVLCSNHVTKFSADSKRTTAY